jgi:hypothetical protein
VKGTRARKIHLAASDEWNSFSDAAAVVDVAGRDRVASACAQLRSTDGCVNYRGLICLGFCIRDTALTMTERTALPDLSQLNPEELKTLMVTQQLPLLWKEV